MPLYVYRIIRAPDDSRAEETFEIRQSMNDPPLTKHPETGEPVERVLMPPNISSSKLGNASLNSAGFTKYVKTSDGSYERQAGSSGPKVINPNDL
jgi:predicted nucleic acid-binding Zn ribbon protein